MAEPVIKFRNYTPKTEELKKSVAPRAAPPSLEVAQSLAVVGDGAEAAAGPGFVSAGDSADNLGSFVGILSGPATLDPVSIAPKKANWDLKRDVEKRLQKLERQTQTAIRELIRRKLETEGKGDEEQGVAEAVATHAAPEYDSDE